MRCDDATRWVKERLEATRSKQIKVTFGKAQLLIHYCPYWLRDGNGICVSIKSISNNTYEGDVILPVCTLQINDMDRWTHWWIYRYCKPAIRMARWVEIELDCLLVVAFIVLGFGVKSYLDGQNEVQEQHAAKQRFSATTLFGKDNQPTIFDQTDDRIRIVYFGFTLPRCLPDFFGDVSRI